MRALLVIGMALMLFIPMSQSQTYDYNGDPILQIPQHPETSNSRGPGDILNTLTGPAVGPKGMAHDGTYLYIIYDASSALIVDENTGGAIGKIPLDNTSDFGLGYDNVRGLFITADASADVVKTYDGVNGTPLNVWPSPGPGPVGAAYDIRRDVYWICDWQNDDVTAVDPTTGAPLITYSTANYGCTRNVGVGYDPINDELITGGRDQKVIIIMDAQTGTLKASFPCHGTSSSPRGTTSTPRQTIWEGDYASSTLWELDAGHGSVTRSLTGLPITIPASTGGSVTFLLNAGNLYGGKQYLLMGSISGTHPGTPLPGGTMLPINWDFFTDLTIALANSPVLTNSLGKLQADGTEKVQLNVLAPLPPAAIGLRMYFAYPVIAGPPWFASNPEIVVIVP